MLCVFSHKDSAHKLLGKKNEATTKKRNMLGFLLCFFFFYTQPLCVCLVFFNVLVSDTNRGWR